MCDHTGVRIRCVYGNFLFRQLIADETRVPTAEKQQWVATGSVLAGEISSLLKALEDKRTEHAKCEEEVSRCEALILVVVSKQAKQLKRLQAKEDTLESAVDQHSQSQFNFDEMTAKHAVEVSAEGKRQLERSSWVSAADAAVSAAKERIEKQRAAQAPHPHPHSLAACIHTHTHPSSCHIPIHIPPLIPSHIPILSRCLPRVFRKQPQRCSLTERQRASNFEARRCLYVVGV